MLKTAYRAGLIYFLCVLISAVPSPVGAKEAPIAPIPVASPEFHFSDAALDEAYQQANRTVDSAYEEFGDASDAGYRALASARGQKINTAAWSKARDSVLNVLRCRAILVDALNGRISLMQKVKPAVGLTELSMLESIVSASEEGVNGTNEIAINMLTALVK